MSVDKLKWKERFESEVNYFLSAEFGEISINELNSEYQEFAFGCACILLETSGSSGKSKWVVHSKKGLLQHAALVNQHLGLTNEDVFGLVIPIYHVGGLGVVARAIVSGADFVVMESKWSAICCVDFIIKNHVSVLSLVPTQLVDIVAQELCAPDSVRVIIVGGGRLDVKVRDKARQLGWPIFESYGMTETGSQIATGEIGPSSFLSMIDGWDVRLNQEGVLEVKGDCLFKGYLMKNSDDYVFTDPKVDGWFTTNDLAELSEIDGNLGLKFVGRSDQKVKILGELVDISSLEIDLTEILQQEVYIVPLADERRGMRLFPVVEDVSLVDQIRDLNWTGIHRLEEPVVIQHLPRNEMGKLQRLKLEELVESIVISAD